MPLYGPRICVLAASEFECGVRAKVLLLLAGLLASLFTTLRARRSGHKGVVRRTDSCAGLGLAMDCYSYVVARERGDNEPPQGRELQEYKTWICNCQVDTELKICGSGCGLRICQGPPQGLSKSCSLAGLLSSLYIRLLDLVVPHRRNGALRQVGEPYSTG